MERVLKSDDDDDDDDDNNNVKYNSGQKLHCASTSN